MEEDAEARVTGWLAAQQGAMLDLLQRIVDMDSNSHDKPGVDAVGAVLRGFLAEHGIGVEVLPRRRHGDGLRAVVPAAAGPGGVPGNVLLMGHRDTVFPAGEAARRPFSLTGGEARGPGVADMKAGLVMICFVLAAFARAGGAPAPLVALFTGDEEIGSPEGRALVEAEARRARVVLNAEPGRPNGNVVTGRKGGVFLHLRIEGRAAHAGVAYASGASAIEELARKVVALHALTDLARGTTVNVGLVAGGQSVNTVAPWAEAEVDLRYLRPTERDDLVARIAAIAAASHVPGTRSTVEVRGEFLPLAQSRESERLFALYAEAARDSGLPAGGEFTGGCADSGFAAPFAPTLCGVGPIGGRAHTSEEYLRVDSLVPRALACARTILRLEGAGL